MVGARASGTEQISQRVSYFCRSWPGGAGRARALIPGKGVREGVGTHWWTGCQGGGARVREGVSNAYKKKKNGVF